MTSRPILQAIREQRVKKLDKKFVGAEAHAKHAVALGEAAKRLRSTNPEVIEEVQLTEMYYSMVARFRGKTNFTTYTPSAKRDAIWRRIIARVRESGVSSEDFLKAQFKYFADTFGCPPNLPSLTTEKAVKRAQDFKGMLGNAVATAVDYKSDKVEILQYYDKLARDVCKAHKITKEQFYRAFVKTGEIEMAKVYLDADPVWRKVNEQGNDE